MIVQNIEESVGDDNIEEIIRMSKIYLDGDKFEIAKKKIETLAARARYVKNLPSIYNELGYIFIETDTKKAFRLFDESYIIINKEGDKESYEMAAACYGKALSHFKLERYGRAIDYYEKCLKIF